ncbi:MAG: hypothetical protein C4520_14350 [Candidatus Abyssobacteria bacterium SURF_5]|uniref:Uncharacterized protein n=1 Tax=Abyssobacteria bacterium (strain SURF_5) TaxID=2093360 RepID=A0A3A4NRW1_ABYX5|nr:MAG: hypothetical protein C4520_14350 [Candidatus Abyssubacteria bacterium SURF_5]
MNRVPARQVTVFLLVSLLLSFSAVSAPAQQAGPKADIIIYVIEASNGGGGVDPQIQHLVKEFKGAFRYSSYQLVKRIPRRLEAGEKEIVPLPGGRQMQLQMQGYEENRIKLRVKILEKKEKGSRDILNTEFRIIKGGTIMIGGYDYRDGKLVMAISAK